MGLPSAITSVQVFSDVNLRTLTSTNLITGSAFQCYAISAQRITGSSYFNASFLTGSNGQFGSLSTQGLTGSMLITGSIGQFGSMYTQSITGSKEFKFPQFVQAGTVVIANGAKSGSVTFGTAFSDANGLRIFLQASGSAPDYIDAKALTGSAPTLVTATGFYAYVLNAADGAIPLNWLAVRLPA